MFVDLHSHVLPAIDDGPEDDRTAERMLELAWSTGTRELVATPHLFRPNLGASTREEIEERFEAWSGERRPGPSETPVVHLGAEHYVSAEYAQALPRGEVIPLAGSRYLLLEFWPMALGGVVRDAVAATLDSGYVPVLAHVERYACLQQTPSLLGELVESGAVAQANADAVVGQRGIAPARLLERWFKAGWIALVASDSHAPERRPPDLGGVAGYLSSRFGEEVARLCLETNPRAVLADRAVIPAGPVQVRRWWSRRS